MATQIERKLAKILNEHEKRYGPASTLCADKTENCLFVPVSILQQARAEVKKESKKSLKDVVR